MAIKSLEQINGHITTYITLLRSVKLLQRTLK